MPKSLINTLLNRVGLLSISFSTGDIWTCQVKWWVTLITLYGPNNDNPEFYDNLDLILDEFNNSMCITCGDCNMVLFPKHQYDNFLNTNNPKAHNKLLSIMVYIHPIDAYI